MRLSYFFPYTTRPLLDLTHLAQLTAANHTSRLAHFALPRPTEDPS